MVRPGGAGTRPPPRRDARHREPRVRGAPAHRRSCDDGRAAGGDPRRPCCDPPGARPRPFHRHAVRRVPPEACGGRSGRVVPLPPARARDCERAGRGHRAARPGRPAPRHRDRDPARRGRRHSPGLLARRDAHRARDPRTVDPALLARSDGHRGVCGPARLAAYVRPGWVVALGAARDHAVVLLDGEPHPADALERARGARVRLHSHRPGQGPRHGARAFQARAQERDDSAGHLDRPAARCPAVRGGDRRDGVRVARHRPAHHRGHPHPRLSAGPSRRRAHGAAVRDRDQGVDLCYRWLDPRVAGRRG